MGSLSYSRFLQWVAVQKRLKTTDVYRKLVLSFYPSCTCSGVTDRGREKNHTPGKLNVKIGPPLNLCFGFSIHLVLCRLLFSAFFGQFSGDLGF